MTDGGIYKGPREAGVDYFDDIMGDNSPPAIFDTDYGGGGMRNYDKVSWKADQNGMVCQMHCRTCPSHCRIEIPWSELFMVAHSPRSGMLPEGWIWSKPNNAPYPDLHCTKCGALAAPIVVPQWAAQQVDQALREGVLSPQELARDPQVQALQARLAQGPGPG